MLFNPAPIPVRNVGSVHRILSARINSYNSRGRAGHASGDDSKGRLCLLLLRLYQLGLSSLLLPGGRAERSNAVCQPADVLQKQPSSSGRTPLTLASELGLK